MDKPKELQELEDLKAQGIHPVYGGAEAFAFEEQAFEADAFETADFAPENVPSGACSGCQ